MGTDRTIYLGIALLGLTSCGKPDASGIYVQTADREVTLVQLIQTSDGKLTGRLEDTTIGTDGTVGTKAVEEDGSISGHDLLLRPTSVWYGGVQASGTISGDKLTLTGQGFTVNAIRSSLDKYQAAVAHLRTVADGDRQRITATRATEARQAEDARAATNLANLQQAVTLAADHLRADADKINARVASSPDFGQYAAANTSRIVKMLQVAPSLSEVERGQLSVAANQVEVGTNQIEVARSQYADELNNIVTDSASYTIAIQKACASAFASQLTTQCGVANSAMADMRSAITNGRDRFTPYKRQVQAELDRQAAMIREMGG